VTSYRRKDQVQLAYDANKKRIRAEASILLDAVVNEALDVMTAEFNEALLRGEILRIDGTQQEMVAFFQKAARKQLKA
jgi:hypothetical protein